MVDVEPAVKYALAQVGKPYVFGAAGPNTFDCSGLTMRAFQKVGINMPHLTYSQINFGTGVSRAAMQRGDLLFPDPGHVQIYLGNNMVVEAPHTGANVRVVPVWGFYAARRLGTDIGSSDPSTPAVLTSLPNPLDLVNTLKDRLDNVAKIIDSADSSAKWLADSHNWYRVFLTVTGAIMIYIAVRSVVKVELGVSGINA